jgi:hypothetical protein
MAVTKQVAQYARGRVIRRVSRSMPWIGAAIAVLTVGAAIRRKGPLGGVLDTALDAMPGVGAVKNAFEAMRGRDFIKDKTSRVKGTATAVPYELPATNYQR